MATLLVLLDCLANISSLFMRSYLVYFYGKGYAPPPWAYASLPFFNSFTLSAYLRVFKVCSQQLLAGDTLAIIVVLLFPVKESFKTYVNLLPLKGKCFFSRSKALIHSLSASKLLLISAPSIFVYLLVFIVSAPLSLPAKSMKLNLPYDFP